MPASVSPGCTTRGKARAAGDPSIVAKDETNSAALPHRRSQPRLRLLPPRNILLIQHPRFEDEIERLRSSTSSAPVQLLAARTNVPRDSGTARPSCSPQSEKPLESKPSTRHCLSLAGPRGIPGRLNLSASSLHLHAFAILDFFVGKNIIVNAKHPRLRRFFVTRSGGNRILRV